MVGSMMKMEQHNQHGQPVKVEPHPHSHSDVFSQQQLMQMARQQQQLLQQQRFFQLQQQQQQQRSQNVPGKTAYEPGMCARRLTQYMYQQQHRPKDNNMDFWRKFVADFFAPRAKKKWCVSMYGSSRQTTGVFPQDVWQCEICNQKPGRGFEATVEVLPRLYKIKYDSGTLEELLYVDMPREYQNPSGQIVLDYAKAIQESVFEQLRVVRDGQLRIVFSPSPELKICSWEFCARHHEELIPRRLLIPQVSQLGTAAQKYQVSSQNTSNLSVPELQNNCNMFVASARQLAKALEVPLVNDLGYTKRYVRCLQISEVVNSMKDLIDYSRETETGPMESLTKFPRRTNASAFNNQPQQPEEQKLPPFAQNTNNDQTSILGTGIQHAGSNSVPNMNNSHNSASTSASSTIVGLLHQNSMKQNSSNANSPYGGINTFPIPNPSPVAQTHHSPFPSSTNNLLPPQPSHNALTTPTTVVNNHMGPTNSQANMSTQRLQPAIVAEAGPTESHSSVQKIIQEMMMSSQLNGGGMVGVNSLGNDFKSGNNGFLSPNSNMGFNGNVMINGNVENNGGSGINIMGATGYGNIGIRGAMGNKSMSMNGRVPVGSMVREQSMNHLEPQNLGNNQLYSGLGAVNDFNNIQFDWKSSP